MEIFTQSSCECKKEILERALQQLYPIVLTRSNYEVPKNVVWDPDARHFSPKRNAAAAAKNE